MTSTLILLRHGESEWNAKNQFTGWVDVDINEKGIGEAKRGAELLKAENLLPDVCTTSGSRFSALSSSAPRVASPMPFSLMSTSTQPVNWFLAFHSLSPWRSRISVEVMASAYRCDSVTEGPGWACHAR